MCADIFQLPSPVVFTDALIYFSRRLVSSTNLRYFIHALCAFKIVYIALQAQVIQPLVLLLSNHGDTAV
jgi:hypothetical protein